MVFPDHNSRDIASSRLESSQGPVSAEADDLLSAEADDLHRLQACVEWLNREKMILTLEQANRSRALRLPRAIQLAPVPGISGASAGTSSAADPKTDDVRRPAQTLPRRLAPPLASERLQGPLARRRSHAGAPLLVLTAIVIAASLAYYASAAGLLPTFEIAQAAALLKP
jgi:hypothetical protein